MLKQKVRRVLKNLVKEIIMEEEKPVFKPRRAIFVGQCTCSHDKLEHALGSCNTDDCKCRAGWEE